MSDPIALPGRALLAWRAEAVLVALALGALAFVVGWVWLDHPGLRLALRVGTLGSAHDVGPLGPEVADQLARHLAEVKG